MTSSGWTKTFTDPSLCAAIVDRLAFGGTLIETGTGSYRLVCSPSSRVGAGQPRHGRGSVAPAWQGPARPG